MAMLVTVAGMDPAWLAGTPRILYGSMADVDGKSTGPPGSGPFSEGLKAWIYAYIHIQDMYVYIYVYDVFVCIYIYIYVDEII